MRKPLLNNCIENLKNLVKVDTRQPDGNETILVEFIENYFKDYNIEKKRIIHDDNRSSIIIKISGKQSIGGICLLAHLDTVEFGDEQLWKYYPLSCKEVDGVFYGRGTADMKGGAAAMLETAICLLENNIKLKEPVYLCFTADEEAGGIGALALLKEEWIQNSREVIVCEPTNEKIGICEKGALWIRLNVQGIQAHGSRPEIAVNAITYAIKLQQYIKDKIDTHTSHNLLGKTTISITKFNSGIMTNIIPGTATFEMDIRTIPSLSHSKIIDEINKIINKLEQENDNLKIYLEIINNRPSVETSENDSLVKGMQNILRTRGLNDNLRGLFFILMPHKLYHL